MKITIKGFTSPKKGEKYTDNYDRYSYNIKNNKFSISDGITLSYYPGLWAELMVANFTSNPTSNINTIDIIDFESIQQKWYDIVEKKVNRPEAKYYERNKFNGGGSGGATFVGLNFYKEDNIIKWSSIALGDSFLFYKSKNTKKIKSSCCKAFLNLFRKGEKDNAKTLFNNCNQISNSSTPIKKCPEYINEKEDIVFFSSKDNTDFDNRPHYFDSRKKDVIADGVPLYISGDLIEGVIYLMTDALAEWFIKNQEEAELLISKWATHEDFLNSIKDLRASDKLGNDDSSILAFKIEDDGKEDIFYNMESNIDDIDELMNNEVDIKLVSKEEKEESSTENI